VERNDIGSRKFEGLAEMRSVVHGTLEGPVIIDLNGVKLEVDLLGGHKTGYYLDQQVNYEAVARYAKGANVLDAFCFIGGFALHAAKAGAARVHGLDQSAEAVFLIGSRRKRPRAPTRRSCPSTT
jgi:23S rRNA (cytosine1962-C5)-methyltransferase